MRKKNLLIIVSFLTLMAGKAYAQQFPDPGFEDWSGAKFAGNAQPKYWNFSNVSQMGVDKNFAHETTGRSGKALKIQDQFVGVMGIGATSPGYVSLGVPWAYVSSLTSINDATAGTYGGIAWTARPDSMVVWIKRIYDSSVENAAGDHTSEEHFHLLYYAWSGTARGSSYKAKNLSCTNISSARPECCVDEESDIRIATNGNECGTDVPGKQIAEGWYHEARAYQNWTRMSVPIFYLNDDTPQKCNVILSAGRYPDFRANNGQNAGSTLIVDDIQLIYSSKVQKLYINNKEWKGFDPNSTEVQTYALGAGATTIPDIFAVRGAGKLTNSKNITTTFPGRRLNESECTIVKGQVDGEPTVITVRSEDGSATTVYRIKFVSQASNNARLSDIRVNGQSISGFNAYLTTYNVSLPYGTTEIPVVDATPQDGLATMTITQPTSLNGQATISVTAGDGTTKMNYTLSFSVASLTDVTLRNIFLDGAPLAGFVPTKSNYTVSLPLGTTTAPTVTWESAYSPGVQQITLLNNSLDQGAQIQVVIPNTTYTKTYKLTYKIEASSYSYLAGIQLDGVALEGFAPEKTAYSITLPMGTTALPSITWTVGDPYQTVQMTEGGVDGVTRIEVTAASGAITTYRLTFKTEKSDNNALSGIAIGGVALEEFDPETLQYHILLPAGTSGLPEVTFTLGDPYQTVSQTINPVLMTVRLTVTAGDGSVRVYTLTFEEEKSANSLLQMIYLNDVALEGFDPERLDYIVVWQEAAMPVVTVLGNEGQSVAISTPASYGLAQIVVTPEEGSPVTYTVRISSPDEVGLPPFPSEAFPASSNAQLSRLYINGVLYEPFTPDTYSYTYPLAFRTHQVPAIMPVAGTAGQTITIEYGAVNRPTYIRVLAEDQQSTATYIVHFTAPLSSNTTLASVEIDGVPFVFDPAIYTYTGLTLPYGTTVTPVITAERAESEQSLVITEAPIGVPSSILVTAEDGTQATYRFSYQLEYPSLPNCLQSIVIDGVGALDLTTGNTFTVDLPYGSTSLDIVSLTKSYPEQRVRILNGGAYASTTITVTSLNPNEADAVYTIHPKVSVADPAMLTDIQADGVTIPHFRPNVFNYVVAVNETPELSYTEQEGADVAESGNAKTQVLTVTNGEYSHTYTITWFYAGDMSFDLDFENWESKHNDDAGKDAQVPTGWYAPINAITSGSKGSYDPSPTSSPTNAHTHGQRGAQLKTSYLFTSAEAIPGFLSLSEPTVTVGAYKLFLSPTHSTLTYGSPRTFRNTPDQIQLDYNLQSYQKITGWRFVYDANGEKQINYTQNFSAMSADTWYTITRDLTYEEDYMPSTLDIRISAAQSDDLSTYYAGTGGASESNHHLSTMYFDNLRLVYNSEITGMTVNGRKASKNGSTFTSIVGAEYAGEPTLVFSHVVSDQMPVVTWEEEKNNKRNAHIRIYGEDSHYYTDYTLTIVRPKSSVTACTYSLDGLDLTVTKGSPYQTVAVTTNDTAYVITVTAENGSKATYYASWIAGEGACNVTVIPAESSITGVSTARLAELTEEPVLNFSREYALDSVVAVTTDTCHLITVYGSDTDTTYIVARHPSSNALLASMSTNDKQVPGFNEETYDYIFSLASLDAFEALPQDPDANVRYTTVPIDANNTAIFVLVTAPDGVTRSHYSVLVRLHTLATDAYLTSLTADGVLLTGFQSDRTDYTISLPAHSSIPTMASVACEGASVVTQTDMIGSSALMTFTITSEDGQTTRVYTVHVNVMPSEVCTLDNLFVGDEAVPSFASDHLNYSIELPYGTASLPSIEPIKTDRTSTVTTMVDGWSATITVTAEDGIHQTVYTLLFSIAKSANADLASILLDGVEMEDFFFDEYHYAISLPFGTPLPQITAVPADSTATISIADGVITVMAEDGVHTQTYVLTFTYLPSTNALLTSIDLDGVQQHGFQPDEFVYNDTVAIGSPMPEITWTTSDEQQKVDTIWTGDTQLTITVTAGDGVTTSEYTLNFEHRLSSNWHLTDMQAKGTTLPGFHSDTTMYELTYPVGSTESDLLSAADITALVAQDGATVQIDEDENHTITIIVTAPDGTLGVYTIEQRILLSSEARLSMIFLDDKELRAYDKDTFAYEITLVPGATLPAITAETVDTLATWELGMETEIENGKQVEVYGEAQDGTTVTYVLRFVYANWTASSVVDKDDYLFFYAGNGTYKAVTIGIGIQFAVYDLNGKLLMMQEMPVADPSDVYVEIDETGNQKLSQADPSANGVVFVPAQGQIYFYVFYDSKLKRIEKGGKFALR